MTLDGLSPDEKGKDMMANEQEVATLGGGCFWCLEAVYEEVQGVEEIVSGYAGGTVTDPTYQQICTGTTGHAEVVQLTYDPDEISFRELLEIFFVIHNPTTLNRQGADVGTQYRSVIFYHDEAQRETAREVMDEVAGAWEDPIVTELSPAPEFYPAEDHHQDYYENNPLQPYCQVVIRPKLAKFRKTFAEKRK